MKFDDILVELGNFGPYQKSIYFLVCLPSVTCALFMVISVFVSATPSHRCAIPGLSNDTYAIQSEEHGRLINETIPPGDKKDVLYSKCQIYIRDNATNYDSSNIPINGTTEGCSRWVYDKSIFQTTATAEMNLVCNDELKTSHAQMIFMGGVLVGAIVFGSMADVIGRKKTLYVGIILNFASGMSLAWAPEFISFVLIRFVNGASNAGVFMSCFVLGMELVGPSKRMWAGVVIEYFFAVGLVILAGLAYLIRDWHTLQIVCSAPVALFLLYWWFVPESARWLISQGREKEAEKILRHAAKVNKKSLPEKLFDEDTLDKAEVGRLWDLFTSRVLCIRTLVIFFNWMVVSMVYYGLSLSSGNLGGSIHLNFLLSGLVEFPAYTMCILLLNRIGRKNLHAGSMILGGVACISTIFTVIYAGDDLQAITITLAMIGKLGAAAGFAVIYVFAAELFPTVVRNGGMGASSMCARVGGMVAPYVSDAGTLIGGDIGTALPLLIFGGASVTAGALTLILPETLGKELPETIADAVGFGSKYQNKEPTQGMNGNVSKSKEPVGLSFVKISGMKNEAYRYDDEKL